MIKDTGFATAHQTDLLSLAFLGASLLAVYWSLSMPSPGMRFRLFLVFTLVELLTFQYIAHQITSTSLWAPPALATNIQVAQVVDSPSLFLALLVLIFGFQFAVLLMWMRTRAKGPQPGEVRR